MHPQNLVLFKFDQAKAKSFRFLFGVDEAGRGPLAGPVVAAAVFLKDTDLSQRVGDSKVLTQRQREKAFGEIHERALVGIGIVSETIIDEINILRASHLAMTLAIRDLIRRPVPDLKDVTALIDGNSYRGEAPVAVECVVKGDSLSLSIACASIVAKVTRDRLMDGYDQQFPQYGFCRHKGYGTEAHRAAIRHYGLCPIHRRTFQVD